MKKPHGVVFFLISLLCISCEKEDENKGIVADLSTFEAIGDPLGNVNPGVTHQYWELVNHFPGADEREEIVVLQKNGVKCTSAPDSEACESAFNALQSEKGFRVSCLPYNCYHYIRYQAGNEMQLVTSLEQLRTFLGEIDTPSDALFIAFADNYGWIPLEKETGSYKKVADGYELLVIKTVSHCTPIQTNRYHLHISKKGEITILGEEVFSKMEDACV